jgi:hypothetical protein
MSESSRGIINMLLHGGPKYNRKKRGTQRETQRGTRRGIKRIQIKRK